MFGFLFRKEVLPPPRTIDLMHQSGVGIWYVCGDTLQLYAWTDARYRPDTGDFVLLPTDRSRTVAARYLVTAVRIPGNPRDQWFADATFSPKDPA